MCAVRRLIANGILYYDIPIREPDRLNKVSSLFKVNRNILRSGVVNRFVADNTVFCLSV
jgi:hypothetical protein